MLAARPSDQLLPANTKGYLSIESLDQLSIAWNQTQLGQLCEDPVMKPFAEDMKRQLHEHWSKSHQHLGITWTDLAEVPSGEITLALVQLSPKEAATVMLVDTTGKDAEVQKLIERITSKLTALKATKSTRQAYGQTLTVFDVPRTDGPTLHGAIWHHDGELVIGDNVSVIETIVGRYQNPDAKDTLAHVVAYEQVQKRCQESAGAMTPHIKWFLEPLGYAEAVRATHPGHQLKKGLDLVKVLKNQGFTAVQGIGGYVNFAAERYEMLHRTAIYAPPVTTGPDKYTLAARMLSFPNSGELEPQEWVPTEIVGYASFRWDIHKAFESVGTLVDDIVGDHVWEDILDSMKTDPNGPRIDLRTDLVDLLGTRVTVLSDFELPITPKSERLLVAVETNDEAKLMQTVEKAMKTDETAHRREIDGHVIYEIVADEQQEHPTISLGGDTANEPQEQEKKLPNAAVTVCNGHLFVATHISFLQKILAEKPTDHQLHASNDYKLVRAEMARLADNEQAMHAFSRTDEEYRAVYELIRTDKMPEAETMLGRLLNFMLGDGKKGVLRHQQIDGHNLPEYDQIRRYFGPAGLTIKSEPNGWFVTGFAISKDFGAPAVAERPAPPTDEPTTTE
jgi:hypothetical protein